MRIPPDAPLGVRTALQEIDERMQAIERRLREPSVTRDYLRDELNILRREVRTALQEPSFRMWEDVFGGSRAVSRGGIELVAIDGKRVLSTSDAVGTWPIPSLIPFNIPDGTDAAGKQTGPDAIPKYNILGSLFVQGALMASKITTDRFCAMGYRNTGHPYSILTHSANQQIGIGPAAGALTFDTEKENRGVIHSTSVNPTRITIPTGWDGLWSFYGKIRFAADATGIYRGVYVIKNGTTIIGICKDTGTFAVVRDIETYTERRMVAGDYVELFAEHDSTSNINIQTQADFSPIFGARWLCD